MDLKHYKKSMIKEYENKFSNNEEEEDDDNYVPPE